MATKFQLDLRMNKTEKYDSERACMTVPPWYPKDHWPLKEFPLMMLQLQMVVIFFITQSLHHLLFRHLGIPPLLSQLLAGIILSPTAFPRKDSFMSKFQDTIFPPASDEVTKIISMLAFGLSLFITAVKMDFTMIKRTSKKPIIIGLSVLVVTTVLTGVVGVCYCSAYFNMKEDGDIIVDLMATAPIMSTTAFPVLAVLLSDLNLLNSDLGRLALSSGVVCDATSIAFSMISQTLSTSLSKGANKTQIIRRVLQSLVLTLFLLFAMFVLRYWLKWLIRDTPKGRPVKERYLILVITLMLLGGIVTSSSGKFVLLGFFIVGAAVPVGAPFGSSVVDNFDFIVSGLLQPFYISTTAMKACVFDVELRGIIARGRHLLVLTSYAIKTAICLVFGYVTNMDVSDSLALAGIMSSKGFVDIGSVVMFQESNLIEDETAGYLILVITIASLVVPMAIKHLYDPLRKYGAHGKRCIIELSDEQRLEVVACICRPDNVSSITNLVTLSSPTTANPMVIHILQLIRLVGRSQPIFISHDLQQTKSSDQFEDIIWAFNSLTRAYSPTALCMDFSTVVSPPKAMHDDICTLALRNKASLIILPFHRKLSRHRHLELDDPVQRAINKSVVEVAPCSVGILIDRGSKHVSHSSSSNRRTFSSNGSASPLMTITMQQPSPEAGAGSGADAITKIAVIFIGGRDDQEAVAYAKRVANETVEAHVIRLVALGDTKNLSLMDRSALGGIITEDVDQYPHISYTEIVIQDGPETAKFLWSILEVFDLIVVGRRGGNEENCVQTSGLQAWSEVSEIGIIGDLLAQPDLKCMTSVLVIQQQKRWRR